MLLSVTQLSLCFCCSKQSGFTLNETVLIVNVMSVWCAFIYELLREKCFNCLYVNMDKSGACFHPSGMETWNKSPVNFQMVVRATAGHSSASVTSTRLWWVSPSLVSPVLGQRWWWYPWTPGSELWLSPLPAPQGCDVTRVGITLMAAECAQLDAPGWVPWFLQSHSCSASSGMTGRSAWKNQ